MRIPPNNLPLSRAHISNWTSFRRTCTRRTVHLAKFRENTLTKQLSISKCARCESSSRDCFLRLSFCLSRKLSAESTRLVRDSQKQGVERDFSSPIRSGWLASVHAQEIERLFGTFLASRTCEAAHNTSRTAWACACSSAAGVVS